mgnify:CR=1 FL=1
MRNTLFGGTELNDTLTGMRYPGKRLLNHVLAGESVDYDAQPDESGGGREASGTMDRRTYLKTAGGLAALGSGAATDGGSFGDVTPWRTRVRTPNVAGFGGTNALPGGSTTTVAPASAVGAASSEPSGDLAVATSDDDGEASATLEPRESDWVTVDLSRNEPVTVAYEGDAVGATAFFLYGPAGRLQARRYSDQSVERDLVGTASRSGTHVVQAVDLPGGDGSYDVTLQSASSSPSSRTLAKTASSQQPYPDSPQSLPGTVQAQLYDLGGEGVAYHDTSSENEGGVFRVDEGVDLERTKDATGEYNVGWTREGEWLEYTVDVTPGTYDVEARVAAKADQQFRVLLDGTELGVVDVPDTGGWQNWQTVTVPDVDVETDGTGLLRVEGLSNNWNLNWLRFVGNDLDTRSPYGGTPQTLPGTVQAQKFDVGGEGEAYHDESDVNEGGAFRPDESVDLEVTDDDAGAYNVGWTREGEWLEYTVDVSKGTYTLEARVASKDGGRVRVLLDGSELATVDAPATGGWQTWETVALQDVRVPVDGTGVLRVEFLSVNVNLNWVRFAEQTSSGQAPYDDSPQSLPGAVQAERFDHGGEGVAYHDTTDGNEGGAFRPDTHVDVQTASDGSNEYNVGWFADGEWLEYTVDVTPGEYELDARVASNGGGGRFRVLLDGTALATVDVQDTGGSQEWRTVTEGAFDVATDGSALLRVEVLSNEFNLNWLRFGAAESSVDSTAYGDGGFGGN